MTKKKILFYVLLTLFLKNHTNQEQYNDTTDKNKSIFKLAQYYLNRLTSGIITLARLAYNIQYKKFFKSQSSDNTRLTKTHIDNVKKEYKAPSGQISSIESHYKLAYIQLADALFLCDNIEEEINYSLEEIIQKYTVEKLQIENFLACRKELEYANNAINDLARELFKPQKTKLHEKKNSNMNISGEDMYKQLPALTEDQIWLMFYSYFINWLQTKSTQISVDEQSIINKEKNIINELIENYELYYKKVPTDDEDIRLDQENTLKEYINNLKNIYKA